MAVAELVDVGAAPSEADVAQLAAELVGARARASEVPTDTVVWAPQPGSQVAFLQCPLPEALYHGTRGSGKTDALLMAFAQHVGRGHGRSWRGVIFRQTYPQLADVVAKSERWFRRIFPGAEFNVQKMLWHWPDGEVLLFRHIAKPSDYWAYHGHELPFVGFEELTTWPQPDCFTSMFSCCRSSNPNVPRLIRATTNPYGPGHHWVKDRYRLHGRWWRTTVVDDAVDSQGRREPARCAIHGHLEENRVLLDADPDYRQKVAAAASNESMAKSWLEGSWDVVAGGMFDDVWSPAHNVVAEFDVPHSWRVDRSFDWGSSRPFAVCWWAKSDGSDLRMRGGAVRSTVRGDLFLVREWYGWTGRPNDGLRMLAVDVARGVVEREAAWGWRAPGRPPRVSPGPADSSIFTVENGRSIAGDMDQPVRVGGAVYPGVSWTPADKRPGSRKSGWEKMRAMLRAARPDVAGHPRERPGLFVVEGRCPQFLRTVLSLPRDEKDLDDVDTTAEDHLGDAVRYRILAAGAEVVQFGTVGLY